MFKNKYQGGGVFELFTGQGNNPVANWKLCGGPAAIRKEYSKEIKGCVYCLEGSSPLVKMQLPDKPKQSLGLIQRFLVLQVNVPQGKGFSIELTISDREKQKKRLHFSTVYKGLSVNLFHAKIPLTGLKNNWAMLFIDLESLAGELFKGISTLDAISLFASCQIRRIFTMKPVASADEGSMAGSIPCSYQFPPDVHYTTCVLNMKNLERGKISDRSKTTRTKGLSTVKPRHSAKEVRCSPTKESLVGSSVSIRLWENNSVPEVQFILHEKVAMPPTCQIKQGLGQEEQNWAGDDPVGTARRRRPEAILEEDFIGSDDDGDSVYVTFQQPIARRKSTPASPGSPTLDMEMKVQSGFRSLNRKPPQVLSPPSRGPFNGTPRPAVRPPTRCLSPILAYSKTQNKCGPEQSRTVPGAVCANSSGSFSKGLLQEVKLNDPQHKVMDSEESDDLWKSSDSSSSDYLQLMQNLKLHEEDKEELQMLASLRREQEEDEYGASSLSGLQVQECNISTSPDAPPWTPVCMSSVGPDDVGEVISLQSKARHSETPSSLLFRERMDALRPPVTSPSQQRRSGNTWTSEENLIRAYRSIIEKKEKKKEKEELEELEDEELEDENDDEDEEDEEDSRGHTDPHCCGRGSMAMEEDDKEAGGAGDEWDEVIAS